MASKEREKIYECEVKRRKLRASGSGYEPFWKLKTVQDAVDDNDTEFRCNKCHGVMKLHRRKAGQAAASHAEHLSRPDAEYCAAGMSFQQGKDAHTSVLAESPAP